MFPNYVHRVIEPMNKNNGNVSETAREFNISQKYVTRWKGQKDILEKAKMNRQLNTIARKRFKVGKSKHPLLDESILEMIRKRRAAQKAVTTKQLKRHLCSMICTQKITTLHVKHWMVG